VVRVVDVSGDMAQCPSCNHPVEDSFSVCPSCGIALRSQCQDCGKRLQQEWQTCPYCGGRPSVKPRRAEAGNGNVAEEIEAEPPPAPIAADAEEPAQRRFRALVIDDERDFRYLLKVFLEHSGLPIDVELASDGREGVELARAEPPDIVLLDVMMPEMDGFEVCTALRADVRTAFVPILMLTALDDAASRTRAFMAGTDDYIAKPFDRRELLARFRRVLGRTYGLGMPESSRGETPDGVLSDAIAEALLQS
jgi:CheY-like chemotaxis protein